MQPSGASVPFFIGFIVRVEGASPCAARARLLKNRDAAASGAVLALSATAFAADHGTADEAKAMLMKAVAALKADKAKTLDLIGKGEGGFLDRDLYVLCVNASDGKTVPIGNA